MRTAALQSYVERQSRLTIYRVHADRLMVVLRSDGESDHNLDQRNLGRQQGEVCAWRCKARQPKRCISSSSTTKNNIPYGAKTRAFLPVGERLASGAPKRSACN